MEKSQFRITFELLPKDRVIERYSLYVFFTYES